MSAYNCCNILKINRLWRTRSIACIPCKILGYKNIRLNLKSDVFGVSIFYEGVGGEGYSSGANIGSQAGSLIGFCLRSFAMLSGTYFLLSTKRNMYSLNHSSVMM